MNGSTAWNVRARDYKINRISDLKHDSSLQYINKQMLSESSVQNCPSLHKIK